MITLNKSVLLILLMGITYVSMAQSLRSFERAGDQAFEKRDFGAAIQYYATVLDKNAADIAILWKYAECARQISSYKEAEKSYLKIAENSKALKKFPLLHLRLAEIKIGQGAYDEAIGYYQHFLQNNPKADAALIEEAEKGMESANTALQLAGQASKVEIKHLCFGYKINQLKRIVN
jgi:tetratricopeptide (TPR) repeat protein